MGCTWRAAGTVELGLTGAAGQRGDLGQRYEFRGQMPRLDSNLEIYIAIKRLVLPLLAHRPGGSSGRWPPDLEPQFFTGGKHDQSVMRTMWCVTPVARRTAVSLFENGTPKWRITTIIMGITSFLRQVADQVFSRRRR